MKRAVPLVRIPLPAYSLAVGLTDVGGTHKKHIKYYIFIILLVFLGPSGLSLSFNLHSYIWMAFEELLRPYPVLESYAYTYVNLLRRNQMITEKTCD